MFTLIIHYITAGNHQVKEERKCSSGFTWEHLGNNTWEFNAEDGSWNAVFTKVTKFTEERTEADGSEGEVDPVTGQVPPIAPWGTGR